MSYGLLNVTLSLFALGFECRGLPRTSFCERVDGLILAFPWMTGLSVDEEAPGYAKKKLLRVGTRILFFHKMGVGY